MSNDRNSRWIDFYGNPAKAQDGGERYESILSHGANQNLKQSSVFVNQMNDAEIDSVGRKNGIVKVNQNAKEMSRSGAKQENFIKTGKLNFKEIKGSDNQYIINIQKKQPKPFGQQVYHANKSDMAEDDPINDNYIAMEMSAAIGNPNINFLGQDIRGFPQIPPMSGSNLSGYELKGQKRGIKTPLLGGMILGDTVKNKTSNISDILQQVNKKSKSTKHQHIMVPGAGLQYGLPLMANDEKYE